MTKAPYIFNAILERVIDGDTIAVVLDQGFGDWKHDCRIRLLGFNAPEARGKHASPAGIAAAEHLRAQVPAGTPLIVRTFVSKKGKALTSFERYIGEVSRADDDVLLAALVRDFLRTGEKTAGLP